MGIFDFLSEIKIKDWMKRRESADYIVPEPVEKTDLGKPMETFLLDDVLALIALAGKQKMEDRKVTLKKINNLEIQLMASLEQAGYRLMAKQMEETILKAKAEHLWSGK